MLLKNVGGLLVYLTILSRIDTVLLLVVIVTCVAGFLVSRSANNWYYQHRDEEEAYFQKRGYICAKAESVEFAKDIRISGFKTGCRNCWIRSMIFFWLSICAMSGQRCWQMLRKPC